jgi:Flp pilus assembly protein TadG
MAAMIARFRRICRLGAGDCGAELIEMALVTPIFLLLVAGIFDFGMLFRSWEVVTNAAREGARVGVLNAYTNPDVVARVQAYMQASGVANACTASCVPGPCSVCITPGTINLPSGLTVGTSVVTVRANQTLPSLTVLAPFFNGSFGTITLSGSAAMRTEQQAAVP